MNRPDNAWRPITALSGVAIAFSIAFLIAWPVAVVPIYSRMFADLGGPLPLFTQLSLRPVTAIAALVFMLAGTAAGIARPGERAVLLSLTAGGGITLCLGFALAMYLPIFMLAGSIK